MHSRRLDVFGILSFAPLSLEDTFFLIRQTKSQEIQVYCWAYQMSKFNKINVQVYLNPISVAWTIILLQADIIKRNWFFLETGPARVSLVEDVLSYFNSYYVKC